MKSSDLLGIIFLGLVSVSSGKGQLRRTKVEDDEDKPKGIKIARTHDGYTRFGERKLHRGAPRSARTHKRAGRMQGRPVSNQGRRYRRGYRNDNRDWTDWIGGDPDDMDMEDMWQLGDDVCEWAFDDRLGWVCELMEDVGDTIDDEFGDTWFP